MKKVNVAGEERYIPRHQSDMMFGPEPPYGFHCNGCTASPDCIFGVPFWVACVWHDWHYTIRNMSRIKVDLFFFLNLTKLAWKSEVGFKKPLLFLTLMYWMVVIIFGWIPFND